MATIVTLEDFEAWQNARELAGEVYRFPRSHPMNRDFGFRDQLRRACVSTMSNLAEAHGRYSGPDKARFTDFSRGSANETLSIFYLGEDIGYFTIDEASDLRQKNRVILGQVTQFAKYLRTSRTR